MKSGSSSDSDPDPATMRYVVARARKTGVPKIYRGIEHVPMRDPVVRGAQTLEVAKEIKREERNLPVPF